MKRILEIKKQIGGLAKKSNNPFFKSQYLDLNDLLNAVEPLLWEHGLILIQPIIDNKVTTLIKDTEDNSLVCMSEIELPPITDPQKMGSAITYFRRYTLKSLLAISEVDDDANLASKPEKKALIPASKEWYNAVENKVELEKLKEHYRVSPKVEEQYLIEITK